MRVCQACGYVSEKPFGFFVDHQYKNGLLCYNYCDECGCSWKEEYDAELLTVVYYDITEKFFDEDWLGFSIEDLIATATYKDSVSIGGILEAYSEMSELYCRCLNCNEFISLTTHDDYYRCLSCGFEWGVLKIE